MEEYYYYNNNKNNNSSNSSTIINNNNCCSAQIANSSINNNSNSINNNNNNNNNNNIKPSSSSSSSSSSSAQQPISNKHQQQSINNYYFYDSQFNKNNNNIDINNSTYNHNNNQALNNSNNNSIYKNNNKLDNNKIIDNLNFIKEYITIKSDEIYLEGIFNYNELSKGVIIFVHGVGSSRFSPRNLYLSKFFQSLGFSTLVFDIMTPQEERLNNITGEYKYNINFISKRIISATQFISSNPKVKKLPIILFGSSTGSAGIFESEGKLKSLGININSIISRSGRLSLCNRNSLGLLNTPTLLICGGDDKETIESNKQSLDSMHYCQHKKLEIISNSSHLFVETGALEKVAKHSFNFLNYHLNNIN